MLVPMRSMETRGVGPPFHTFMDIHVLMFPLPGKDAQGSLRQWRLMVTMILAFLASQAGLFPGTPSTLPEFYKVGG